MLGHLVGHHPHPPRAHLREAGCHEPRRGGDRGHPQGPDRRLGRPTIRAHLLRWLPRSVLTYRIVRSAPRFGRRLASAPFSSASAWDWNIHAGLRVSSTACEIRSDVAPMLGRPGLVGWRPGVGLGAGARPAAGPEAPGRVAGLRLLHARQGCPWPLHPRPVPARQHGDQAGLRGTRGAQPGAPPAALAVAGAGAARGRRRVRRFQA